MALESDKQSPDTPKRINFASSKQPGIRNTPLTNRRIYRGAGGKWVTREIASLDFLSSIPLAEELNIVTAGRQQQRDLNDDSAYHHEHNEQNRQQQELLERPSSLSYISGRRLEGDPSTVRIRIPLTDKTVGTRQRSIARAAALREWELQTAHGLQTHPPLLGGRLFLSADSSYPVNIYSIVGYEPKREEAAIRRRKVEAIGGGGTQFVLPERDWRGISYRALLHRDVPDDDDKVFNRFVHDTASDDDEGREPEREDGGSAGVSSTASSSEGSCGYIPGLLDDPEMVLGCYRNVMIGDSCIGPIVASTIQFVDPALLKEELNKQFRDRFDGWEPPKSACKYIGAKVIQGNYVLHDPTDDNEDPSMERRRKHLGSVASVSTSSVTDGPQDIIRMPPSLTLSKIRSLKRQALQAAVKSNLNIGTLALSCVYFERLCLDCRVDKTNRRLSFAACILLASKWSEPNVGLVMKESAVSHTVEDGGGGVGTKLQSLIRPNKRSSKIFASLLYFFTEGWNLSLKHLFSAEWGVFVALGFSLHASPSDVSFHFKRFMKSLEWNAVDYLGSTMYDQWQDALVDDEARRKKKERMKLPQIHGHSSG